MEYDFGQLNEGESCKTYLFREPNSKEVVFVDPILTNLSQYTSLVEQEEFKVKYVIDTHTHADHISGAAALSDITGADYVMGELAPAKCVSLRMKDGDKLSLGGIEIQFMYSPGHTKDAMSVILPGKILTGDALFLDDGGAGRDDLPGGDPGDHWETLQRFLSLPEELVVYPAHDYRNRVPSNLKQQKAKNPHLKPRTKHEFIQFIENLKLGPADWMKAVLEANFKCSQDPGSAYIPVDTPACEVKGTLSIEINEQQINQITPEYLKSRIGGENVPKIIDVREIYELKDLPMLPGAENIPMMKIMARPEMFDKYKESEVIFVCHVGGRSTTIAQIMKKRGFDNVMSLKGGMQAWVEKYS